METSSQESSHVVLINPQKRCEALIMNDDTTGFPPEKRLEPPNSDLTRAGIATIYDMRMVRECVGYENANHRRPFVLDLLARRAQELRMQDEDSDGRGNLQTR